MDNKYRLGSYSISERAAKIGKLHAKDFQRELSARKNQGENNSVLPHLSKEYENVSLIPKMMIYSMQHLSHL